MAARYDLHVVCLLADHFWMRKHLVPSWARLVSASNVFYYPWESWNRPEWPRRREAAASELLHWLREQHARRPIDLLFALVYDDFMTPQLAQAIRATGVRKMVNYNVDMQHQWYRILRSAPYFDLICGAQREYLEVLSRHVDTAFVPMAANVEHYRPQAVARNVDVLFVGWALPERKRALAAAWEVTHSIAVYGPGWTDDGPVRSWGRLDRERSRAQKLVNDLRHYFFPRLEAEGPRHMLRVRDMRLGRQSSPEYPGPVGGFLADESFVATVSTARIALGINQRFGQIGNRADSDVGSISGRLRDFELPACGVMYLAQRYPELAVFYREGQEIEGWSSLAEMQRKLDYYLAHDVERERLARAGRQRVLQDHTWEVRFEGILHRLGLGPQT